MKSGSNYALRAITGGTISALGAGVLWPVAAIAGQLLLVALMHLFGGAQVHNFADFVTLFCVSFGFGLLSGVGALFVILELYYLMKVLHEQIGPIEFFFIVAACQVGLYLNATLMVGTFSETWLVSALALAILGGGWWVSKILRHRAETALLARMDEEGQEFCRELRERHLQQNLRRLRRRR